MVQTVQEQLPHRHQLAAQELLQVSANLNKIYLDQFDYLSEITAHNFFQFDPQQHKFSLANQLLNIYFDEEKGLIFALNFEKLPRSLENKININRFVQYFSENIYFYTTKYHEIHPTDLSKRPLNPMPIF